MRYKLVLMMVALLPALLCISTISARAGCIDEFNALVRQTNALGDRLKNNPDIDLEKPAREILPRARRELAQWEEYHFLATRKLTVVANCTEMGAQRSSYTAEARRTVTNANAGLEPMRRVVRTLEEIAEAGGGTTVQPLTANQSSGTDSSQVSMCVRETSTRVGKEFKFKLVNTCNKSVSYDFDDCDQDFSAGVGFKCTVRTSTLNRLSESSGYNFHQPPNARNFR